MSRVCIWEDIPAQICWKYCHGELDEKSAEIVQIIVSVVIPDSSLLQFMIYEIAHRIGFAKSVFAYYMNEVTYKQKKLWIRNTLSKEIKNESTEKTCSD